MEEHPQLIFDCLLVNESINEYKIPSVDDSNYDSEEFESIPSFEYDSMLLNNLQEILSEFDTCQLNNEENYMNSCLSSTALVDSSSTNKNNDLINKDLLNKNIENSIDEFLSEEFKNLEDEKIMQKISIYKTQHSIPSVTEYVVNAIQNGLKANKIKPGRPKQEFDTSFHAVNRFFEKYINKLQSLVENNFCIKRSDTFRFTIFSYLKKLPIKLREMSCSVSDPKSNRFEIYLDAFLSPFVNCFLKYFDFSGNTKDKLEHFLYFISICFPTSKCCQVLDVFLKEGTIDKETIQNIKINLKQRKGKSKKDILSFLNLNPCFKRYSANLLIKLDNSKFNEHANTMIKDFIQI